MYSVKTSNITLEEWMACNEGHDLMSSDPMELMILKEELYEEQGIYVESIADLAETAIKVE